MNGPIGLKKDGQRKRTLPKFKNERSQGHELDGLQISKWSVLSVRVRSKRMKLDGPEILKWTVHCGRQ